MAKGYDKKNKEYESIKTIFVAGQYVDVITVLSYTPSDGGKGYIVKVRNSDPQTHYD